MCEAKVLDQKVPQRRAVLFDAWWDMAMKQQEAYMARKRGEVSVPSHAST